MHACMFVRISSHVVYVCCEGVYICMCHMYVYMCACLHMYRVCVSAYVLCVHVCVPTHVCVCVNVCVHMHMSAHGMHACMCVCLPAYVCECVCVYVFVYVSVWCLLILLEKFPINLNFYLFFSTILNLFSVPCNLKETDPVHCLKVTNLRGGHPYYRWPTSFGGRLSWLKTPPPPLVHQGPRVSAQSWVPSAGWGRGQRSLLVAGLESREAKSRLQTRGCGQKVQGLPWASGQMRVWFWKVEAGDLGNSECLFSTKPMGGERVDRDAGPIWKPTRSS